MSIIIPGQEEVKQYADVQLPGQPFIKGKDVENPFNERHDINATHEAVQQMLAGGTPNWVKWPQEYKSYAREAFAAEKEKSDKMGAEYKWHDQEVLTDKKARHINGINTRDFIERKLRANGIKCAIIDSGWIGAGGRPTVGLFCVPPTKTNKLRPICYLDVPMMWEWSVLKLDPHGLPAGEETRGWRTVAVQLVEKDIITEAQCHRIFGAPPSSAISARYYRSLWEKRHGKPYADEEDRDGFGS